MTRFIPLSLATLDTVLPVGSAWVYEEKLDGYRIEAVLSSAARQRVTLYTRNANDWTATFPDIADAVSALPGTAVLDGEVVVVAPRGVSAFQALQQSIQPVVTPVTGPRGGHSRAKPLRRRYVLFDVLALDGIDIRQLPLAERQTLLRLLLRHKPAGSPLRMVRRFSTARGSVLQQACTAGLEGVVCKRRDAPYVTGRHRQWLKVKCAQRQEFVVVGYTEPRGTRAGLGALLLAVYDDAGALHFAGKVGSGFDTTQLEALAARLAPLVRATPPVERSSRVPRSGVHWVRPTLVAEVSFAEWTTDGLLRHPVFQGLRDDKAAREVRRETPDGTPTV
jgi:bifunctional non-homologous end joining protein LigD